MANELSYINHHINHVDVGKEIEVCKQYFQIRIFLIFFLILNNSIIDGVKFRWVAFGGNRVSDCLFST